MRQHLLARDRGKALEPRLFANWNGMPSTAMLRHRDDRLPAPLKARYKDRLRKHLPDLTFPSLEEEERDSVAADATYASAGAWLLSQTRDRTRFGLLFEEGVNYGFRRNFWALKTEALLVGSVSLLASIVAIGMDYARAGTAPTTEAAVATGLIALYILFVALRVNTAWVRLAADAFGRQLLAARDVLAPNGELDRLAGALRNSWVEHLGLEQPDQRLGEPSVVVIADTADGGLDAQCPRI